MGKKFFTRSVHRNALSRNMLESPILKTFQKWSGKDNFSVGLAWARDCVTWFLDVTANLNYSTSQYNCELGQPSQNQGPCYFLGWCYGVCLAFKFQFNISEEENNHYSILKFLVSQSAKGSIWKTPLLLREQQFVN